MSPSDSMFSLSTSSWFSRVRPGVAQDRTQFSKLVPQGAKADAIYRRHIVKFARINGIMKDQYFTTRYREKDVWRRNRLLGESAYFKKWHYIKYCCQLIKYATKNELTFGLPYDVTNEFAVKRLSTREDEPHRRGTKPDGYSESDLVEMQAKFLH